jgi:glutathione S-transferase
MITLFQFYRVWGLPNASPFCMKIETYLRMAKLPYENKFVNNPQKSPKRKLPHIKMDGKFHPDSELIIDELKRRFGDEMDKNLTAEQKALAVLIDLAFCERLYWVIVYLRWQDTEGWEHLKESMFVKLPALARLFVPNMIRKYMLKQLDYQGIGRHHRDEVLILGIKTLDTLITLLGENKYFLGDKPTCIDATAFAFLVNVIWTPLNDPLKKHALLQRNIVTYCNRMWDEYYPDFVKPDTV